MIKICWFCKVCMMKVFCLEMDVDNSGICCKWWRFIGLVLYIVILILKELFLFVIWVILVFISYVGMVVGNCGWFSWFLIEYL